MLSLWEGFGVGFRRGSGGWKGGGVGTRKGTGKSMRTRLSKPAFQKNPPFTFSPNNQPLALHYSISPELIRLAESLLLLMGGNQKNDSYIPVIVWNQSE